MVESIMVMELSGLKLHLFACLFFKLLIYGAKIMNTSVIRYYLL